MPRVTAEIGSTASSYQILAKLATGGMAEIFLARGASVAGVERYVVLKRVLRERASDPHFIRMFLDEARLAAQLQHPNVAQVYDIGKLGDSYFFTMEYVHGETVRSLLQHSHAAKRPIPTGCVLAIAAGAAAGLHHAHERIGVDGKPLGIVHRDVSPSNLMISYEGNVKVVDFGVAKASHRATETRSGTVKGKISYLSPEQCRGRPIDRRSDLFSLGIVMWELLTLERLYRRDSDFENMQAIVNEPVVPPSARRPGIRPELDRLVIRLLSKEPEDRYQTADELHEAVDAVAVHSGTSISASSLGRYTRDLFGLRPEPWVSLSTEERVSDIITVTGEPIPAELVLPVAPAIDRALANVRDLSKPESESSEHLAPRLTTPMQRPSLPTVPHRVQAPPTTAMPTVPVRARSQSNDPLRTLLGPGPMAPPMVYPHYSYSQSGSQPAMPSYTPGTRTRRIGMWVGAGLIALVVTIAIVIAARGSKNEPLAQAQPPQQQDAAVVVLAPSPPPPAIDAAVAVTAPPPDAADLPQPEPTITAAHAEPLVQHKPVRAHKADSKTDAGRRPDTAKSTDVVSLYADGRDAEVIAVCETSTVAAANVNVCVESACRQQKEKKARSWFVRVPASARDHTKRFCEALGILLETKAASDCKNDPMACQR